MKATTVLWDDGDHLKEILKFVTITDKPYVIVTSAEDVQGRAFHDDVDFLLTKTETFIEMVLKYGD